MIVKKLVILPMILLITLFGIYYNIYLTKVKPSSNYYISNLTNSIKSDEDLFSDIEVSILTTDFYNKNSLKKEFFEPVLYSLLSYEKKALDNTDGISFENSRPKYKYIVKHHNQKYIIDVYNETYFTIYYWDGEFKKDVISMKNSYPYENLYKISEFVNTNLK